MDARTFSAGLLPGPDGARAEAVTVAGEMLRDVGGRFWNSREWRLWVTD